MMFDWCKSGDHKGCRREFKRYFIDPKGNMVWLDEIIRCECKKRGCLCYTAAKDRKPKRAVRKQK